MSVMLYLSILCGALLMDLFVLCVACLTVFVNCLVEVLCGIYCVWSSKECPCCACDPSVHLTVHSIGVVYAFVCRKLSPHFVTDK